MEKVKKEPYPEVPKVIVKHNEKLGKGVKNPYPEIPKILKFDKRNN